MDGIVSRVDQVVLGAGRHGGTVDRMVPREHGLVPSVDRIVPRADGLVPPVDRIVPRADGMVPSVDRMVSRGHGSAPPVHSIEATVHHSGRRQERTARAGDERSDPGLAGAAS